MTWPTISCVIRFFAIQFWFSANSKSAVAIQHGPYKTVEEFPCLRTTEHIAFAHSNVVSALYKRGRWTPGKYTQATVFFFSKWGGVRR